MFFDSYYFTLVLPAIIFAIIAQARVSSAYKRFARERTIRNITGARAAEMVLRLNNVSGVRIERIDGTLTDHFDPRENVIRLSRDVYDGASVAAVGIAAHEAGHAAQYEHGYGPVRLRSAIIPATQIGSTLSWPLVLIGLVTSYEPLFIAGIALFSLAIVFQLITLPVEYNASARAMHALDDGGVLDKSELHGARKVLNAAALTYLAALAVSIAQMLRLLLLFGGRRRSD